jgi:hypothetical protein
MEAAVALQPPSGMKWERRRVGRDYQYRLATVKGDEEIAVVTRLYEQVAPLIDELDVWGETHECQMSPNAIRIIAVKLRRFFEEDMQVKRPGRHSAKPEV